MHPLPSSSPDIMHHIFGYLRFLFWYFIEELRHIF